MIERPKGQLRPPDDLLHRPRGEHTKTSQVLVENLVKKRAALPEGTLLAEATPKQTFDSQILFALRLGDLINATAEWKHDLHPHLPIPDELSKEVKQTRNALTTLYVLKSSGIRLDKWRRKWKQNSGDYEEILENLTEHIEKQRAATIGNASLITDHESEEIRSLHKRHVLSKNYRQTLVTETEPNVDKRKKEIWNVGMSGGLSLPTLIGGHIVSLSVTTIATAQSAIELGAIYDWKTALAVLGATGMSALSIYANYRAQLHLLKEVGISPGIGAKLADYMTTRLSPGNEKLRRRRILIATAVPTAWIEPALILGLLFPGGPLAYVAYQVGSSAVNLLEAGGSEGIVFSTSMLRKRKARKERRERKQQGPEQPTS
jgi:hypothetical protein